MSTAVRACLRLCVQVALLHLVRAWLFSSAGAILSEDTLLPVRLRCINWYAAHMETFVTGGLDTRSCGAIADRIVAIGANCVRIPLSVQLVLHDPPPTAVVIPGLNASECSPANASTAFGVVDCQVCALTRRGLMVVLNTHTSAAGWVGAGERVPQGLWHSARFPTLAWVASLAALAARYRTDRLVVGIDIRNEVHDQDGVVVTWG
jgi:endoglucanase